MLQRALPSMMHGQYYPGASQINGQTGYGGRSYGSAGGMPSHIPHGSFQSMTAHWMTSTAPPTASHTSSSSSSKSKSGQQSQNIPNMPNPPKAPDKPLMPYVRYNKKMWDKMRADGNSELKLWDISRLIGSKWREMSEEEKQPYIDEYESEKLVYNEQLKAYHNSPAYKKWLEDKKLAEQAYYEVQQMQQQHQHQQEPYAPPPPQVITPSHTNQPQHVDSRMVGPSENDDIEYVTNKQIATARYYRNHRLMADIFSDTPVPDTRSVVSEERLQMLQTQSQSLKHHQEKLEQEIKRMEDDFQERKRKMADEQRQFEVSVKKLCDNPCSASWKKPVALVSLKDFPLSGSDDAGKLKYTKL